MMRHLKNIMFVYNFYLYICQPLRNTCSGSIPFQPLDLVFNISKIMCLIFTANQIFHSLLQNVYYSIIGYKNILNRVCKDNTLCEFPVYLYDCDNICLEDDDYDGICNLLEIAGCTVPSACNYNDQATDDDGSCEYPEEYYDFDGNCIADLDCF